MFRDNWKSVYLYETEANLYNLNSNSDEAAASFINSSVDGDLISIIGSNGLFIENSRRTVLNNLTLQNNQGYNGGGLRVHGNAYQDTIKVYNGLITQNQAIKDDMGLSGHGGGIYLIDGSKLYLENCVIADNAAEGEGNGAYFSYGDNYLKIRNSIFWNDMDVPSGTVVSTQYSCIKHPNEWPGMDETNITDNPQFRADNYHLSYESPCVDAGDPAQQYNDAYISSNTGRGTERNDMGAYGGPNNGWYVVNAKFEADITVGNQPLSVQFTDLSANDPTDWLWDFGDGEVSGQQHPQHTYNEAGIYTVQLVVWNSFTSDTARYQDYIEVRPTHVVGEVYGVWDTDTVRVEDHIVIPEDKTLIIKPGVKVYFTGPYHFEVFGQLIAEGTVSDSIVFFSDSTENRRYSPGEDHTAEGWNGLRFYDLDITGQDSSYLSYCRFSDGNAPYKLNGEKKYMQGGNIYARNSSCIRIENSVIERGHGMWGVYGYHSGGGGIYLNHASPVLNNIRFTKNFDFDLVADSSSNPTLSNIHSVNSYGFLFQDGSNAVIDRLTVEGSLAQGVACKNASPLIKNAVIKNVRSSYFYGKGGGAVYLDNSSPTISNSQLLNNSGERNGGGLYCYNYSSPVLNDVRIEGNTLRNTSPYYAGFGGGIYINENCSPTLVRVVVKNNSAVKAGGGIYIGTKSNAILKNTLVAKNRTTDTDGSGAGIYIYDSAPLIENCTVVYNESKDWAGIRALSAQPLLRNSIVYYNSSGDFQTALDGGSAEYSCLWAGGYPPSGPGNTEAEPQFRDTTEFHLKSVNCYDGSDSPLIDAGNPAAEYNDFAMGCTAGQKTNRNDMGIYGGPNNLWPDMLPMGYERGEVSGTWGDKMDTIRVAGDIIVPAGESLHILPGTTVQFLGHYRFIVYGQLLAVGKEDSLISFSAYYPETGWYGLRFINTSESGQDSSRLSFCRFEHGLARGESGASGGALSFSKASNVLVKTCSFKHNFAQASGGAIYISNSNPQLLGLELAENESEGGGGAVSLFNSNPEMRYLMISGNSANDGGALQMQYSSPVIRNSVIAGNQAVGFGGALHLFASSPKLSNVTLSGNLSANGNDGLYLMYGSEPEIINSILWGNGAHEINVSDGNPTVRYSCVQNGAGQSWFGDGCITDDPLFVYPDTLNFILKSIEYGYNADSPCIDAGHPDSIDASLSPTAGLGTRRADMGAFGGSGNGVFTAIGNGDLQQTPEEFSLAQNYPNPFNPTTTIRYTVASAGKVRLTVYNILGQKVRTLVNKKQQAGQYAITFDAKELASGVYIYRLQTDKGFSQTRKMILIR